MTIDEQIEILKAYKDGKRIEKRDTWINGFKDTYSQVEKSHQFNFYQEEYRIAPEPELVPWTAEDVPMPFPILREKYFENKDYFSILTTDKTRILIHGWSSERILTFGDLFEHFEHSTDGKTWKPCWKGKK